MIWMAKSNQIYQIFSLPLEKYLKYKPYNSKLLNETPPNCQSIIEDKSLQRQSLSIASQLTYKNNVIFIDIIMSGNKVQLSQTKKTTLTEDQAARQSHSSLDKLDKKQLSFKYSSSMKTKKNNVNLFKPINQQKERDKSLNSQQWPSTNKRRYLKNYQLPKIHSPMKLRKEELSEYDREQNQNLIEDEEKLIVEKHSVTLETSSPTKKPRLAPIRQVKNFITAVRTKAGTNGRQTKINQDVAIVQQKLPHNLKLYCVCDGHGLNGHYVSAFIKSTLIKNLCAPLKKFHHPPEKEKLVEIIYNALHTTNEQLLQCDINTELAGSTLVAVFIYNQKLLTFNVGDSRAILLQQMKMNISKDIHQESKVSQLSQAKLLEEYQWFVEPLSIDQKPERPDEKERILKFGGRVFAQTNELGQQLGPVRVWMKDVMMPGLAMSRSFGDKAGIKSGTNAEPQLIQHQIDSCDKIIVIASDGVWQYLQNQDVLMVLKPYVLKDDLNGAADSLMKKAVQTWAKMNFARDDITLIIVKIGSADK